MFWYAVLTSKISFSDAFLSFDWMVFKSAYVKNQFGICPLKACREFVCGFSKMNSRKLTITSDEIFISSISFWWLLGSRKLSNESETSSSLASFGGSAKNFLFANLFQFIYWTFSPVHFYQFTFARVINCDQNIFGCIEQARYFLVFGIVIRFSNGTQENHYSNL